MKILLINNHHYLMGGSEKVYFETAHLLKEKGHSVVFFSVMENKTINDAGKEFFVKDPNLQSTSIIVKFRNIGRFIYSTEAKDNLEKLILHVNPDIAHLHIFYGNLTSSILPILKKYKIPTVMSVHEYRMLCPTSLMLDQSNTPCELCAEGNYFHAIEKKCNKGSLPKSIVSAAECYIRDNFFSYENFIDYFIMVSKFIENKHLEYKPNLKNKILQLYNFIDLNCYSSPLAIGKYYLYIGRLSNEKGIETLIQAFSSFPNLILKIVGDGQIRAKLESCVVKNNLNNIEFLGYLSQEEIKKLQSEAKFIIVPSECYENNPLVIIESLAMSKPIIGANIGGIPELINEGYNGFLFTPKNIKSLIFTIQKAELLDEETYLMFCKNSRIFAENMFSREKHYDSLIELYEKLLYIND